MTGVGSAKKERFVLLFNSQLSVRPSDGQVGHSTDEGRQGKRHDPPPTPMVPNSILEGWRRLEFTEGRLSSEQPFQVGGH